MGSTLLRHQEKSPFSCLFCKKPHKSQNCRIVSDIRTRKNIVRTSKRCFVCLKGSHLAKDCSSKIKCFKCSKRHRITLCDSEGSGHSSNSFCVMNIAGVNDNTNILLQIAKVKVQSCENSCVNSARVLVDSCSQSSYITPPLRNRLKLKIVSTRKISIQAFGNKCSRNVLEKVNLRISALDGSEICVTCFAKEICAPLNNQNTNLAKQNFPHIKNVLLAVSNPNNESLSIDILFGADYYWSIINNQFIKSKEGPIALDTKVGWMLRGPVNNPSVSVNDSVLLSHVVEVQSEFRDTNNVLKQDLNKVWFDLKETNADSESVCFDFKKFQKENITFNETTSCYEVGLPFKEYHEILSDNCFNCKKRFNSLSK